MPTQLVIVEKPSVAAKLASALSSSPKQHSSLGGVKYFELERSGKKIFVAPAVGHLYTLAATEKGSHYPIFGTQWVESHSSSKDAAFTKKYLDSLKRLAKQADEVVSACDFDIEGSTIAGMIIRYLAPKKPAKRMLFSTLTKEELAEAYDAASPLDVESIEAGETRHQLDWLWGINSSRALMHAIKSAGLYRVMSIGRVQGPALDVLAKREKEIRAFVPQKYWQVFARARETVFSHSRDKFFDGAEAEKAFKECENEKSGAVEKVERRKFKQLQPFPFDLTTLQVEAYRNFGFSPSQTLEVAQDLYEAALIAYPRTSSQKLPEKLGLQNIIRQISSQPAYSPLAQQLISAKRFVPREGEKTDSAHVAIYPTGQRPSSLPAEQQKLYDLIVKRFLSLFAPEARRETMSVKLRVASHLFIASGTRTIEKGWFAFYEPYVHLEEVQLPDFKEGGAVALQKVWKEEKETQPPRRFTPASLVRELERQKLGTKATRSSIIDTLFARHYLADKKSIKVTDFGLEVHAALQENVPEILSEQLTRKFEDEMDQIQEGKRDGSEVVAEGKTALSLILTTFKQKEKEIGAELVKGLRSHEKSASVLGSCKKCGTGQLQIRKSRFGFFVGCSSYPNCDNTFPLPRQAKIEPKNTVCEKCGTPQVKVIRAGKRPFEMCLDPQCPTKAGWKKPAPADAAQQKKPVSGHSSQQES